jgi:spermidine/putrescine transport system substrate-binding protein
VTTPRFSRRSFIVVSGAAVLAACTDSSSDSASTDGTTPGAPTTLPTETTTIGTQPASPDARPLRLLMPPDSIANDVLERFAEEQGVQIDLEVYVDPAFVLDRIPKQQGDFQYDLVVMPGLLVPQLTAAGLLAEIDRSLVPSATGLLPEVQQLPWDPDDTYTICKEIGFTGFAWDRAAIPDGVSTWAEYLDLAATPDVSGKVLALYEGLELVAIPSWASGVAEPETIDADAMIAAIQEQLAPHLLDLDSFPSQRMLEGGPVLAQMWSGEGRDLVAADPDRWGYAIGAPATGGWAETFVVPANAPDPELAHALIELMLDPDVSLAQVDRRGYNSGLASIQEQIADLPGGEFIAAGSGDFGENIGIGATALEADPAEVARIASTAPTEVLRASNTPPAEPATVTSQTPVPPGSAAAPNTTVPAPQFDDKGRQVLRPQDNGDAVVQLQNRLTALGFSLGRSDGDYGDVTLAAVLAFQRSQGLATDGVVGRYTWDALENPKPISAAARSGSTRGAPGGNSDAQQHASGGAPSGGGGKWVKAIVYLDSFRDEFYDSAGNLVATFPNSPGVNGLTPTGTFQVYSRSADTYYSKNPAETMKWMVRFNGGVGFHSVPRINGTPEPTPIGQAPSSHGCIRHADDVAKQIYDNLVDGATVIVKHG